MPGVTTIHFKPKSSGVLRLASRELAILAPTSIVAVIAPPPLRKLADDLTILVSQLRVALGRDSHAQTWKHRAADVPL